MLDPIQTMAAKAAVKNMLRRGSLSICAIDEILKMTGGVPKREDYQILHLLHCVDFMDMDPELLRGLPLILSRVLDSDALEIEFEPKVKLRLVV
jgi:hypothetical protein